MALVGVLALQGSFNEHIAGTSSLSLSLSYTHFTYCFVCVLNLSVFVYGLSAEKARSQRRGDKEASAA